MNSYRRKAEVRCERKEREVPRVWIRRVKGRVQKPKKEELGSE